MSSRNFFNVISLRFEGEAQSAFPAFHCGFPSGITLLTHDHRIYISTRPPRQKRLDLLFLASSAS